MEKVQVSDWLNKEYDGYMVNTTFSDENAEIIINFLKEAENRFGDAVYCMQKRSLHITLLDWIAPLLDYGGSDKYELFSHVQKQYDAALANATSSQVPFNVRFNKLHLFPNTIVLLGQDEGQFASMRADFINNIDLLPDAKLPPQIIHSSVIRFRKEIDMTDIEEFVSKHEIDLTQEITHFRLIHTIREPLVEFDILKTYDLGKSK